MMREKNLDNVKWILTLLIVLYHIQMRQGCNDTGFLMIKNLGDSVVPAFSMISGFLFWKTVNCFSDLRYKFFRRITSLMIPYVLWNLINTIFLNWRSWTNGNGFCGLSIWDNLLMWKSSPHFWYIFMLMFWTLLSPILFIIYRKKIGVAILFLVTISYLFYKGNGILHSRFIYIIYLWAGVVGFYYPNVLKKAGIENKRKRMLVATFFLFAYLGIYYFYCDNQVSMGIKVWFYGIRALFLLVALINFPMGRIGLITGFKYSFWIFAVHYWLDCYIGATMIKLVNNLYVYQILTWLVVVIIGLTTGAFFDKRIPVMFRILSGNRG